MNPAILKPTFKSGRSSVMIWASIIYWFKGPMTILNEGRMSGSRYSIHIIVLLWFLSINEKTSLGILLWY